MGCKLCVWSAVKPFRATYPLMKLMLKLLTLVSSKFVICATRLGTLREPVPSVVSALLVDSRVISPVTALSGLAIATVMLWMHPTPPPLRLLGLMRPCPMLSPVMLTP